jgi:hypothetical protein
VLTRYDQSFGAIDYAQNSLNSFYTGGTVSVRGTAFRGFNVNAAYTLGKAINEESSFSNNVNILDAADPGRERGRSDGDARQKLSLSLVWQIAETPFRFQVRPRPGQWMAD